MHHLLLRFIYKLLSPQGKKKFIGYMTCENVIYVVHKYEINFIWIHYNYIQGVTITGVIIHAKCNIFFRLVIFISEGLVFETVSASLVAEKWMNPPSTHVGWYNKGSTNNFLSEQQRQIFFIFSKTSFPKNFFACFCPETFLSKYFKAYGGKSTSATK